MATEKNIPTETTLAMAFQRITMNQPNAAAELWQTAGNITDIYDNRNDIRQIVPDATDALCRLLATDWHSYTDWAEKELEWCHSKHINFYYPSHPDYPERLQDCPDAPVGLFSLGTTGLNNAHIISIVGTRKSTPYGHDFIHRLITDLKQKVPDVVIVSGLAYGIDVCAHRESLQAGLETIGVLAHGLDTMYPASHRETAARMVRHGGLLTEYPSQTRGDRQNFLRRNRIVAGISDCTIVAESMVHGGSLVTARIANDYQREVFAVPGRATDLSSQGCNDLIRNQKAHLLQSADDIIEMMGWQTAAQRQEILNRGIEKELFVELTDDQQRVVDVLRQFDLQLNLIAVKTGLHISKVNAVLFELEMRGIVKAYAGGTYHLQL